MGERGATQLSTPRFAQLVLSHIPRFAGLFRFIRAVKSRQHAHFEDVFQTAVLATLQSFLTKEIVKACKDSEGKKASEICPHLRVSARVAAAALSHTRDLR